MSAATRPAAPLGGPHGRRTTRPALDVVRVVLVGITLNLCWVLGCLLLVTALPATAALHAAVGRWRTEGDEPTPGSFLADLRRTLAPGVVLALLLAAVGAVLGVDVVAIGGMGAQRRVVLVGWLALTLGVATVAVRLAPALAASERPTVRGTVRLAAVGASRHPVRSVAAVLLLVGVACLLGLSPVLGLLLPAPAALAVGGLLRPGPGGGP